MDYPDITFSVTKYWLRDAAYIHISSTETVAGRVYQENEYGVFLVLSGSHDRNNLKIVFNEDKATYLFEK